MVTVMNRNGVAEMVADLLRADTTVLYGSSKLLNYITHDSVLYENAKIDINNQYKMFLSVESKSTIEKRSHNCDELYTLAYRIEGMHSKPDEAKKNIDKIDERISVLIDNQFNTGNMFTSYYTVTGVIVYDAEYDSSNLTVDTRNDTVIAECDGAISVYINREE